jgi:hypothetical protein
MDERSARVINRPSMYNRRVAACDWTAIAGELDESPCSLTGPLLDESDTAHLVRLFDRDDAFRSTVHMARHQFGEGVYRYFRAPLPPSIDALRHALYLRLVPIAREWHERLARPAPWPDTLDEWLTMCQAAGQDKPTPLLLRYETGGWNALHRDLYGDLVFPLQVVINLTQPDVDYVGGEFLMVEQRARAQSKGTAISIPFGHGLVVTTRDRPVRNARGWSAAPVRHGVSRVRSGTRLTAGVIFHDAR